MNIDLENLVWVNLPREDSFQIVLETLTRIGIASKAEKKLTQSCHILHKRGKYAIVHFKELFLLDGKEADFHEDDIARRNTIANLLNEWGLVELVDPDKTKEPVVNVGQIKILPSREKSEWTLTSKYTIGNKKKKVEQDIEYRKGLPV